MDTSKKYIEMCEKAEEIQKLCQWEMEHDFFGYIKVNKILVKTIWLPRQDQLQEMITNKGYFGFSLIELFYHFANEWHRKKGGLNSMEQLWLAFVMKEKYNKVWNGKEWGG